MEIGIDSFAAVKDKQNSATERAQAVQDLLERVKAADKYGLDVFGIGEHHRREFQDAANTHLLAAAATMTENINLTSAVTVLSANDPVRVFQNHATLDLLTHGRAEMVVGRGSFNEAFPLFGYQFKDYDDIFSEKLDLLLKIREHETLTWSGKFRPMLNRQTIYPRPFQKELPIWVGVGGTPESFERAGRLGLPLMIAIIGGETHRFRPLVDLYRDAGQRAGHSPDKLKVGVHSLGFVAKDNQTALDRYFPGYKTMFDKIGRERGWGPVTRGHFEQLTNPSGALVVGDAETVATKIKAHSQSLGGLDRFTFQMDNPELTQAELLESIKLIGEKVRPLLS